MKDFKYLFGLHLLILLLITNVSAQTPTKAERAAEEVIFVSKTAQYEFTFVKFGDGFQDLSYSEGPSSLMVGGNLIEILTKLNPEYIWDIHRKHLSDNYQLKVNFYSIVESKESLIDDILNRISKYLGVDFRKEKVKLTRNCLLISNFEKIDKLKSVHSGLRVRKSKSHLEIYSVRLENLVKILNDNLPYNFELTQPIRSLNHYDFNIPIKNEAQILGYFDNLGFGYKKCEYNTTKIIFPLQN
jgi:hypothetical protein